MEAFSHQIELILSNYTHTTLRKIIKQIKATATKKPEMISIITRYICDPEQGPNLSTIFPKELLNDLAKFLPDKQLQCICDSLSSNHLITCKTCNKKQHSACMGTLTTLKFYECPRCQMTKMNPAESALEYFVYPSMIPDKKRVLVKQFNCSPGLLSELSTDPTIEIQLRCMRLQNPGYSIAWPKEGTLFINKKPIKEFKENSLRSIRRIDSALDLSIAFSAGLNEVSFIKKNDSDMYCLAVLKVRKNSEEQVFRSLSSVYWEKSKCIKFIAPQFTDDIEVKESSKSLTMRCPYTFQLINTPARGKDCNHLNCFDLMTFICMQKCENYDWKCPICKGPAYQVYVDMYFDEILKEARRLIEDKESKREAGGSYIANFVISDNGRYEINLSNSNDHIVHKSPKRETEVFPAKAFKISNDVISISDNTSASDIFIIVD